MAEVKICGLMEERALNAAIEGGARYLGFVFAKSRHFIEPSLAAHLIAKIPPAQFSVGLFVDPTDDELAHIAKTVRLTHIQLHGRESPERVAAVKALTGLRIIKAVGISTSEDVRIALNYEGAADLLLLDAKAPSEGPTGGRGVSFDWSLLRSAHFALPWLLAGGLNASNIENAVAETGAMMLDVSSGVEDGSGSKSPSKIREFLELAQRL
ncbi:MAG: phosphoribosylanthranilate isomerase [Alphaproteobacteria bacterium]|nr:phosphoribosylanthranilate isomerase [Alphaproteobacteria bacterium]